MPLKFPTLLGRHWVTGAAVFSPGGRFLADGGFGVAHLWEIKHPGYREFSLPDGAATSGLTFFPDGMTLITGSVLFRLSPHHAINFWDISSGTKIRGLMRGAWVLCIALSPQARLLAVGTGGFGPGNKLHLLELPSARKIAPPAKLAGWAVGGVAFFPDGHRLAANTVGAVHVVDVAKGREVWTARGRRGFLGVAVSPDSELVASGGNSIIVLLDARSGAARATLRGHKGAVDSVEFSPNGSFLVSAGRDHTVRLWDVASGKELKVLRGHRGWVTGAHFSPDGRLVVSSSRDGTVRLWDVGSGRQARIWKF
jgi:WD40 repeat protein